MTESDARQVLDDVFDRSRGFQHNPASSFALLRELTLGFGAENVDKLYQNTLGIALREENPTRVKEWVEGALVGKSFESSYGYVLYQLVSSFRGYRYALDCYRCLRDLPALRQDYTDAVTRSPKLRIHATLSVACIHLGQGAADLQRFIAGVEFYRDQLRSALTSNQLFHFTHYDPPKLEDRDSIRAFGPDKRFFSNTEYWDAPGRLSLQSISTAVRVASLFMEPDTRSALRELWREKHSDLRAQLDVAIKRLSPSIVDMTVRSVHEEVGSGTFTLPLAAQAFDPSGVHPAAKNIVVGVRKKLSRDLYLRETAALEPGRLRAFHVTPDSIRTWARDSPADYGRPKELKDREAVAGLIADEEERLRDERRLLHAAVAEITGALSPSMVSWRRAKRIREIVDQTFGQDRFEQIILGHTSRETLRALSEFALDLPCFLQQSSRWREVPAQQLKEAARIVIQATCAHSVERSVEDGAGVGSPLASDALIDPFNSPPLFYRQDANAPHLIRTVPRTNIDWLHGKGRLDRYEVIENMPTVPRDFEPAQTILGLAQIPYDSSRVRVIEQLVFKRVDMSKVGKPEEEIEKASVAAKRILESGHPLLAAQDFLGSIWSRGNIYLVSQKIPGLGNLWDLGYQKGIDGDVFPRLDRLIGELKEIVGDIHGDIEPRNLVPQFDRRGNIKKLHLVDFETGWRPLV
ncbi:hypothetical protein OAO01_06075 [Oligoflexia bacterium]|nr:hypothetical protein [Oligoflexia bacterium]